MSTSFQTILRNNFIHYYKKITYRKHYKKIEYMYDILHENDVVDTYYHNDSNPAVIVYSNNKISKLEYWYKGELHRENAPAIIYLSNNKVSSEEWYLHNIKLTDKEIDKIKKKLDRKIKILKLYKK